MSRPRAHVFVCVNQRGDGNRPSCGDRGRALVNLLQRNIIGDEAIADRVAVTGTECLGECFAGPVAVVYPGDAMGGQWLEPADGDGVMAAVQRELAK